MYYILDRDGNYIKEYRTTIEAAREFETTANLFSRCARNIELMVKGYAPKSGAIAVKGLVCVKKCMYDKYESEIRKFLTKDDILVINKKGVIVGTYKNISDAHRAIKANRDAIVSASNASKVLNKINRDVYGYRLATREYYINQVQKDPICYMKEYDNLDTIKVAVDMYNIETDEYIRSFNSLTEAAEYFGCSKENIRQCINTGRPVVKSKYYVKRREE